MGLDLGAAPLRIKLRSVPLGSSDGQNYHQITKTEPQEENDNGL